MNLYDIVDDLYALKEAYELVCEELAWCSKKFTGDTTCSGKYYEKLFFEKAREKVQNNDKERYRQM